MTVGRRKSGFSGVMEATLLLAGCATAEMAGEPVANGEFARAAAERRFEAGRTCTAT